MKVLIPTTLRLSLAVFYLLSSITLSSADTTCYDCGYLQDSAGDIGPIVEVEYAVNFCNGTDPTYWPTKTIKDVSKYMP